VKIELDPSNGINIGRLPHVPTAGSQRLRLVFQVTQGANLIGFRVGDQTVGSCNLIVEARR
jgi:hypothetical protein